MASNKRWDMKLSTRVAEVLASCYTRAQTEVAISYAKLARKRVRHRYSVFNPPEFAFWTAMEESEIDSVILRGVSDIASYNTAKQVAPFPGKLGAEPKKFYGTFRDMVMEHNPILDDIPFKEVSDDDF